MVKLMLVVNFSRDGPQGFVTSFVHIFYGQNFFFQLFGSQDSISTDADDDVLLASSS